MRGHSSHLLLPLAGALRPCEGPRRLLRCHRARTLERSRYVAGANGSCTVHRAWAFRRSAASATLGAAYVVTRRRRNETVGQYAHRQLRLTLIELALLAVFAAVMWFVVLPWLTGYFAHGFVLQVSSPSPRQNGAERFLRHDRARALERS